MKTSTKNTIITAIIALICSLISIFGTKEYIKSKQEQAQTQKQEQIHNQSITLNLDGREISYFAEDVENLNDKRSELETENSQLKANNELLEDKVRNLTSENNKLFQELDELKKENEDLASIISKYQENSKSTLLDSNSSEEYKSFLSECMPYYKTNYVSIIENNIKMCGVAYSNGMKFACDGYYALFNLDGKYDKLKFDVGHVDNSTMSYGEIHIYVDNLDSNPIKIIPIEPDGMVESYEIDLNGGQQLKIATVADKPSIFVGIVNMEVK